MNLEQMKAEWRKQAEALVDKAEQDHDDPDNEADPSGSFWALEDGEGSAFLECGCLVFHSWDHEGVIGIRHCPLHEKAEALYGALVEVVQDLVAHVKQEAKAAGLPVDEVCPCWGDVNRAGAVLQALDPVGPPAKDPHKVKE